ncbi:Transmembrane protein 42 [Coemansia javaensis]|uniref:Transmembrane protein 42 n=1 Tax=Coemansia javaensis TaxID=2761396 RepID=A0A9W8HPR4_9FUNG|nr:Transmembrane protein 42 [Coemansia javaensis]
MPGPAGLCAVLAGLFAALGSAGAKLAVGQEGGGPAARAALAGATAACNVLMWLAFTKALRYSDSTPRAMTLQTVSNFAATAVCGVYLFGDALSLQWWAGAALIAAGLAALNTTTDRRAAAPGAKKTQ